MQFRYIPAKIQLKNLKQHFDWGGAAPWIPSCLRPCFVCMVLFKTLYYFIKQRHTLSKRD